MNCLVGQSGGPTSVINSSLAGVIQAGLDFNFDKIYALRHGIEGLLKDNIVEIDKKKLVSENIKDKLMKRPSSILGSCRYRLTDDLNDDIYRLIFEKLKKLEITNFVYIGGNDSMDTVKKLNAYMIKNKIDWISIVGSPKTIDNDLMGMDHSPGFGSASKYIINTINNIRTDVDIYDKKTVTFVEIMGRNAGWLTASSLLTNYNRDKRVVNLIYLSEKPCTKEQIIEDIKKAHEIEDNVIVAVSEGFMDSEKYFEKSVIRSYDQGFNHPIISGIASRISDYIYDVMDIKTKAVELNISQRTNHIISKTDAEEAFELGYKSLEWSREKTNIVPVIKRKDAQSYEIEFSHVISGEIANMESIIPQSWMKDMETLEQKIYQYALPLVKGEMPQEFENGMIKYITLDDIII